ncbi:MULTISPECIES: coniferyl aldehyde dehydrogenase [unclassified Hyphomonas]|jgi:coniferyl-aldehyde dehydrogenase|uniref:coniferyl aldehyde dehydrogenase n=1 Tax=unclassified Hyphomonas TaxID=2630699 RepID=UPI000458B291|nr:MULTISPECIES: coniferyl aldehyde dehydrogenase [unclassified Hyphomonas]KCZ47605.1 coniferyl aldehyde dehydrogenase [Hyphomonas sp. CY54-11-8]RAN39494.1 coniferyl aldehyde dehydrogenase [Hyphomonas sp. GM-8P]
MALDSASTAGMAGILARQKAAHIRDGIPSAAKRIEWLDKAIDLLITYNDELVDAMCQDFGHRSKDQSGFTDIAGSIGALKHAKKHVAKWMRPEKRKAEFPLGLLGAKAQIQYQPKGVIGVISPWNFPVNLTFAPLAGVFAAGNRCMIKPSEFTELTSEVMKKAIEQYYDEEEVAVITGGPEIGAEFTKLAFDHILFTGATSIAHHVMRAAADNLVPLTLELGGKSPVVLGRSADLQKAATRIMAGKTLNAGQICLAPDYAFVPKEKTSDFVAAATKAIETMYPSGLKDNDDYTSIVNQRHFDRIMGYIDEAKSKGAEVIEINPTGENFSQQPHHKIPPHIIVDPSDDLKVMQDEIFGPILPIKSYSDTKDTIAYINTHDRPLGLYYFGEDAAEKDMVLNNTTSGGVTVNDVIMHVGQEDLPFGGVGPSGMGSYHGREGFLEFSHKKSVFTQTGSEMISMIRPPYGEKFRKQIQGRLKR